MTEKINNKEEPLLTVRIQPASSRPKVAALLCFGIAFFAWGVSKLFGGPYWGIGGGILLFLSLSNFFFPTVYVFYDQIFKIRSFWGTRDYKYSKFRYLKTAQNGIFLSPYPGAGPLDFIRGVFILMDKDQVLETADLIRGRLAGVPGEETSDA